MGDVFELVDRRGSDPLGGRRRVLEVFEALFYLLEAPEEPVVSGIGDLLLVVDVVGAIESLQGLPELLDLLLRGPFGELGYRVLSLSGSFLNELSRFRGAITFS